MRENIDFKRQMLRYVGDFSQLFGVKEYTLAGGRAAGEIGRASCRERV